MQRLKNNLARIFFVVSGAFFVYFWSNVIAINSQGDLIIRQANMWADWALHFTFGSTFAEQSLWHLQNPLITGLGLSYPPAANWLSALLIRLQVPFFHAFILPSMIFSILIPVILCLFFKKIFNSSIKSLAAASIFLLNGGFGFLYFFADLKNSNSWLETIIHQPREYTDLTTQGIHFMSFLTSMIFPQRNFTIGFPLVLGAVLILLDLLVLGRKVNKTPKLILLSLATIILGLSPLIHPHSSLAAGIILCSWFAFFGQKNTKEWLAVGLGAMLIAAPSMATLDNSLATESFISIQPGFMYSLTNYSIFTYWIINWGVVPILASAGLVILWRKNRTHFKILLPFVLIFIAANIWQFQPWIWDNMKLFAWSAIGISALAAITLSYLWKQKSTIIKSAAIIIFCISILSGFLEQISNLQFNDYNFTMYTAEELELANWVKNNTDKNGVWLSGDHHNNWAYNLTGRQAMLTYPGWLTSHGLDAEYIRLHSDYSIMLNHPQSELGLFDKYDIKYVSIGPNELKNGVAELSEFDSRFRIIKETENYTIFERR